MKHGKLIFIILLVVLLGLLTLLFFSNNFFRNGSSNKEKEIMSPKEKNELIEDIVDDIDENYTGKEEDTKNKSSDNKDYDQYLVASGYSGANDNVYYTKDGVLYHLTISTKEITKIAEGVLKIENSKGTIEVYKGKSFKLYKNDDYLTFVD